MSNENVDIKWITLKEFLSEVIRHECNSDRSTTARLVLNQMQIIENLVISELSNE